MVKSPVVQRSVDGGSRDQIGGGQALPGLARLLQRSDERAGLCRPLLGLMGHVGDPLHGSHQVLRGQDLVVGRAGDPLDQPGRLFGNLADPLQRGTGLADPLRLALHFGLFLAEGPDALLGVGLDGLDDRADLAGGRGSPLRQFTDLLGDDREASAMFPGADRFDRGVEGEHVGAAGDAAGSAPR